MLGIPKELVLYSVGLLRRHERKGGLAEHLSRSIAQQGFNTRAGIGIDPMLINLPGPFIDGLGKLPVPQLTLTQLLLGLTAFSDVFPGAKYRGHVALLMLDGPIMPGH